MQLNITEKSVAYDDGYLEANVEFEIENLPVGQSSVGQYYLVITDKSGMSLASPAESALLTPDDNTIGIWKSFWCSEQFEASQVSIYCRLFNVDRSESTQLTVPSKDKQAEFKKITSEDSKLVHINSVACIKDKKDVDLMVTLNCADPQNWAWAVTGITEGRRNFTEGEPFGASSCKTVETAVVGVGSDLSVEVEYLKYTDTLSKTENL